MKTRLRLVGHYSQACSKRNLKGHLVVLILVRKLVRKEIMIQCRSDCTTFVPKMSPTRPIKHSLPFWHSRTTPMDGQKHRIPPLCIVMVPLMSRMIIVNTSMKTFSLLGCVLWVYFSCLLRGCWHLQRLLHCKYSPKMRSCNVHSRSS